ncbi:hypothetical protein tb265_11450 [Gemmatimonadetes bacterium T265]|nr:hypothetical protein tb265_11450 [Gemmatimonadetes bacterium T265]
MNAGASARAGLVLGAANPKAYLACASLFASFRLLGGGAADARADALLKWGLCVAVAVTVDLAWLGAGAALGRVALSARGERALNVVLGATVGAAALAVLW